MVLSGGILVIEDDPSVSAVLVETLQAEGYNVATASNGAEAIPLLDVWRPDLVLTDLAMPEMNGLDFIAIYLQQLNHAPVVAISAMTMLRRQALARGAVAFVPKPFDMDHLLELVGAFSTPDP